MLDTSDLIVHLSDGRRMRASVLVVEPELDAALVKIRVEGKKPDEPTGLDLPFFDVGGGGEAAARRRPATGCSGSPTPSRSPCGTSRCPSSAAWCRPYTKMPAGGACSTSRTPATCTSWTPSPTTPAAAGGALTDRKGNLLGVIGREIRNSQTDTWMNYAIPLGAKAEVDGQGQEGDGEPGGVRGEGDAGASTSRCSGSKAAAGPGGYHGIVFVPNVLERTPAYVEDVRPGSPAAKAGAAAGRPGELRGRRADQQHQGVPRVHPADPAGD